MTPTELADGRVVLHGADCRDVLRGLDDNSIDSVVCDPPYALVSIVKRFGKPGSAPANGDVYNRSARGFMGKTWDNGEVAFAVEFWAEVLRVLKPGGHVVAFSGTRTYHRMAVAIEDAGFEIRDQLGWLFGSGFPKSHDVSKGIDKKRGETGRDLEFCAFMRASNLTRGTASKILQDAGLISQRGTMAGHFFAASQSGQPAVATREIFECLRPHIGIPVPDRIEEIINRAEAEREIVGQQSGTRLAVAPGQQNDRSATSLDITAPATDAARQWQGWGTALKPAWEPICLARKPLDGTVAENVMKWGTGALNIDGTRVPNETEQLGRWPANIVHDGSDEVVSAFPDTRSGGVGKEIKADQNRSTYGAVRGGERSRAYDANQGSAARFFYCAKASRADRDEGLSHLPKQAGGMVSNTSGQHITRRDPDYKPEPRANIHPTVKPTDLMQWLCRLVTPPGGVILDPFMGSGSTGKAAVWEGFRFIGCEREEEYIPIAEARIRYAVDNPPVAEKPKRKPANDNTPPAQAGGADLFGGAA